MSSAVLPLPSLPDDRRLVRVRELVAALDASRAAVADPIPRSHGVSAGPATSACVHATAAAGCMSALVARAAAHAHGCPVICVTADIERARRLSDDLAFVTGGASTLDERGALLLPPNEASPYADVNPDRRAAMARLAVLARLASGAPFRFLVLPAAALVRKVVPREVVASSTVQLAAEQEIDRDPFLSRLSAAGYLRVPLVEDPGTFAVRGAIIDVWPTSRDLPVRIELYGDLVLSLRTFDPHRQRTSADAGATIDTGEAAKAAKAVKAASPARASAELRAIQLPPAREAIASPESVARAREVVRELCDAVDLPSSRARALSEDVAIGRAFYGAEGFLPAYYPLDSVRRYLPDGAIFVLEDPPSITLAIREELARAERDERGKATSPHLPVASFYATASEAAQWLARERLLVLHRSTVSAPAGTGDDFERFEAAPSDVPTLASQDQSELARAVAAMRSTRGKNGGLDPLIERINAWREAALQVVVATRTETQAERLFSLLRHRGIDCRARAGRFDPAVLDRPAPGAVDVVIGPLSRGVVALTEALALVTEEEIFGQRARRAPARRESRVARAFLEDLRALEVGDYVVHVDHGVGRYGGLIHKNIGGVTVDLITVEYAAGDKLYLPVYRLNQIQKWAGGGEGAPKLDRLGGQTFSKTKSRVERQVRQLADELLRLYAERQASPGEPVASADDDYRTFEATFPFDETPDQARAIDEVLSDLEKPRPMDRLVCGDVGFGKTEVAVRAAFRTVQSGRQVAVLCPTTVLAQQHFLSFDGRMQPYGVRVAALSRFQSRAEQLEVVRGLKEGKIDVVVGTHRLLSKDVHFKRLGLLVVDEEQRFGVTHKERIKQIKTSVHVLTLTATPIPRTLQMAVSGLRDMSLIATAPTDRRAVRTIVTRMDNGVIAEAIRRELARGGQVFYVYNRVEGIYERAARIQELVPEARIAVGHGQMNESALEQTMIDFIEGRYDVLVSTAIIESGLDIPRANTILIDRADTFGLAQLYQLRGRVGRSKERGYCYLIAPPASSMTDEARQRIEALERYTELGSGFQIASLDLELRGAGDLLGAEQSGNVALVGFDLFCRMLEEAVHELRGEPIVHEVEPELSFDVEALLPEEYVADIGVRLSLYKRLASAADEREVDDLALEMEDRFGPPPAEAKRLVSLMRIKTELRRLRVLGCEAGAKGVTLHLCEDTPLDPVKLTALVSRRGAPYKLTPDMRLSRRMTEHDGEVRDGLVATEKMLVELSAVQRTDATTASS